MMPFEMRNMKDVMAEIARTSGNQPAKKVRKAPTVQPYQAPPRDPKETVTVVIPSIPPRRELLKRALNSVYVQTSPVDAINVSYDIRKEGAWVNRWNGAQTVKTKWTAFLDDDDELLPNHIEHLLYCAEATQSDMVWGWFDVVGGIDPWPHYRGKQYDPSEPHVVPITYMVKTELLLATPGFSADPLNTGAWDVQDMPVLDALVANGAKLYADPATTWLWHHDSGSSGGPGNTSGRPDRW